MKDVQTNFPDHADIKNIKSGMSDERWKTLISFAQFIIGTVIVGMFGTIINNRIQTREVEIKEQEQIFRNLDAVLSDKPADRLLMAQFYAAVTRSDDIRSRWILYRDELRAEIASDTKQLERLSVEVRKTSDAREIEQKQALIQNIDAAITPTVLQAPPVALPARVYFHIRDEAQRDKASDVARKLSENAGIMVPGVQLVTNAPPSNQLRYFKYADSTEAESISRLLRSDGIEAGPTYVAGYESSKNMRARHFELWIAKTWNDMSKK